MAEYRRFVSYFYEYQDGKKGRNTGFARMERRGTRWKLLIHINGEGLAGVTMQVYALARKGGEVTGTLLGRVYPMNRGMERMLTGSGSVGRSAWATDDLAGIWVTGGGRDFVTVWDDETIDPRRIRGEDEDGPSGEEVPGLDGRGAQSEPAPAPGEQSGPAPAPASVPDPRAEGGLPGEIKPAPEKQPSSAPARAFAPGPRAEGGLPGEIKPAPEKQPGSAPAPASVPDPAAEAGLPGEIRSAPEKQPGSAPAPASVPGLVAEGGLPGGIRSVPTEQPSSASAAASVPGPTAEAGLPGEAEPAAVQSGGTGAAMQPSDSSAEVQMQQAGGREDGQEGTPGETKGWNGALEAARQRDWAMVAGHCRTMACPQELPAAECRRVGLNHLDYLRQRGWRVGRNSFLLHGWYQYRFILLAKMQDGGFVLGVPGNWDNQERYMARMYGFTQFYAEADVGGQNENELSQGGGPASPAKTRLPQGYWCRRL